jgi:hypothetical protein
MAHLEWFLSFAEITFPVFLLLPALVTSLHILEVPLDLVAVLYGCTLAEYVLVIVAIGYFLAVDDAWLTLALFAISTFIVSVAFQQLFKWTLHEFTWAKLKEMIAKAQFD